MSEMAKNKKGRKTIKQSFYLYNMVIQPVEKQSPDAYIDIFKRIFNLRESVPLSKSYHLAMRSLNFQNDGSLYGTFIKFQDLEKENWYNSKTNTFEPVEINEDLHPNIKEIAFYFYPDRHRLAVESYIAPSLVLLFFEKNLSLVTEGSEVEVVFNVVKTKESIAKIASNKSLTKLEICISYTNSDNLQGWERFIDKDNKDSNVTSMKLTATGQADKPIDLEKNRMLLAALALSRENGYASAIERTDNGIKKISSEDSPEIVRIKYPEGESVIQSLRNCIFNGIN